MENRKLQLVFLTLLVCTLLLALPGNAVGQELGGGAKLVGTTPFVFAEAKFWIFSVELGAGVGSMESTGSNGGSSSSGVDLSLAGKTYPLEFLNFAPYVGVSSRFSIGGTWKASRTFGGVEFNFPGRSLPLSAFAGGGLAFTEAEGSRLGWHLGIKYRF